MSENKLRKDISNRLFRNFLIGTAVIIAVYSALSVTGNPTGLLIEVAGVPTTFSIGSVFTVWFFSYYANVYVRRHFAGATYGSYRRIGFLLGFFVIGSVIVHEFAHGAVSQVIFGDHIVEAGVNGLGAYVLPTQNILEVSPIQEILVTLAGPMANLLIAWLCWVFVANNGESLTENSVQYLGVINTSLAKFNLIPIVVFLDGGKVLHGTLRLIGLQGTSMQILLVGIAILLSYRVYRKLRGEPMERRFSTV